MYPNACPSHHAFLYPNSSCAALLSLSLSLSLCVCVCVSLSSVHLLPPRYAPSRQIIMVPP